MWLALGETDEAVTRVVTVLVISCPHALGLAIPLTTSISSAMAATNGILVKDRLALEESRTVQAFLFDKTGTLTKGQHTVVGVAGAGGVSEDEVLRLAGGVESDSEHPLARAIVTAARTVVRSRRRPTSGPSPAAASKPPSTARPTPSVARRCFANGPSTEPAELADWAQQWKERGAAVLYLVRGDTIVGGIALEDEVRPEARDAVGQLQAMGRQVVMITGDARQVADAVGRDLGVDEVFAEVLPEDKANKVAELQAHGLKVAMVGDGVNDAPALATADVGIAIGAGTDVAIESAGLILASSDPRLVVSIIRLSEAAYRKSLQNLWWAAGYNVLAIPIAAGALMWAGICMPPAVAAILMSASTIVVAANAQLLRRVNLRPAPSEDQPRPASPSPSTRDHHRKERRDAANPPCRGSGQRTSLGRPRRLRRHLRLRQGPPATVPARSRSTWSTSPSNPTASRWTRARPSGSCSPTAGTSRMTRSSGTRMPRRTMRARCEPTRTTWVTEAGTGTPTTRKRSRSTPETAKSSPTPSTRPARPRSAATRKATTTPA